MIGRIGGFATMLLVATEAQADPKLIERLSSTIDCYSYYTVSSMYYQHIAKDASEAARYEAIRKSVMNRIFADGTKRYRYPLDDVRAAIRAPVKVSIDKHSKAVEANGIDALHDRMRKTCDQRFVR